jgi:hypothetical protein
MMRFLPPVLLILGLFLIPAPHRHERPAAEEPPWIDLSGTDGFSSWRMPTGDWFRAEEVGLKSENPRQLQARPDPLMLPLRRSQNQGEIFVNGPSGKTGNLITSARFRDVEFTCEFLLAERSNSGVKFNGMYEIQLLDSFGKQSEELTGSDCGGIYPRGESLPQYHTIDRGTPPRVNASRRPGQWQELYVSFRSPRFDAQGKKTENARFLKVILNHSVIHENVEVRSPTGSAWRKVKEVPQGPILLQGDHGPVAFRKLRARPME